ncbi:unnamed protein product [Bursaphelenchus xylophilus]|nr:unnamed protein product [Bursaphelenchus xylophilus]CAG9123039.1 unnamed protein product [Bursaphelenchus xylophilus]
MNSPDDVSENPCFLPVVLEKQRFTTLLDHELCNLKSIRNPQDYLPASFTAVLSSSEPSQGRFYISSLLRQVTEEALSKTLKAIYEPEDAADDSFIGNTLTVEDVILHEEYIYVLDGVYKRGEVEEVIYSEPPVIRIKNRDFPQKIDEIGLSGLRTTEKYFKSTARSIGLMGMEVFVPAGFRFDNDWMRRARKGEAVDVTVFNMSEPFYGVFERAMDVTSPFNAITLGREIFEEDYQTWVRVLSEQSRKVCKRGSYPYLTRQLTEGRVTCFVIGHEKNILYVRDTECFLALSILKMVLASYGAQGMADEFAVQDQRDLRVGCAYVIRDSETGLFFRSQLIQATGNRLIFSSVDYPSKAPKEFLFSDVYQRQIFYPFESLLFPRLYTTVSVTDFKSSDSDVYDDAIGMPLTLEYDAENRSYYSEIRTNLVENSEE